MDIQRIASRREFLKQACTGAAILRGGGGAALLAATAQETLPARSRVAIARDSELRGKTSTVDSGRALSLLDRAMQALFDRDDPISPWRKLVRPGDAVGLKVNTLGGRGISTSHHLVEAVCERLQQAGYFPVPVNPTVSPDLPPVDSLEDPQGEEHSPAPASY